MVVRVHPHSWRWRAGGAVMVFLITFCLGYLLGASRSNNVPFFNNIEERLRDEIVQLTAERDSDQLTLRALKSTLSDQATVMSEMRQMLEMYRGVLLPDEDGDAVVLRAPTTEYDPLTQSLKVVINVHRGVRDYSQYEGDLSVKVEGLLSGQPHSINISSLDSTRKGGVFPLKFQYLQRVQIAVSLPVSFVPEVIVSSVTMTQPSTTKRVRRDAMTFSVSSERGQQ